MTRLVPIKAKKLAKLIEALGFRSVRQKGSHVFFRHKDSRTTVVPLHRRELGRGLMRKILRDINLSVEKFDRLRRKVK